MGLLAFKIAYYSLEQCSKILATYYKSVGDNVMSEARALATTS